jgi:hypothetical protein
MCNQHQQETKKTMPWVGYLILAKQNVKKKVAKSTQSFEKNNVKIKMSKMTMKTRCKDEKQQRMYATWKPKPR